MVITGLKWDNEFHKWACKYLQLVFRATSVGAWGFQLGDIQKNTEIMDIFAAVDVKPSAVGAPQWTGFSEVNEDLWYTELQPTTGG